MKKLIINTTIIFILSTLAHTLYDIIPSPVTQVFFPVNESIWEHFKMLFTSVVIFSVIEKKNIPIKALLRGIISTTILALIYLPVHFLIGEILPITLIILAITIFITEYLISKTNINNKKINVVATLIIIIIYVIFNYLTENPPKEYLFLDQQTNTYGIPKE